MPRTASAKKALRENVRRRARNLVRKSAMREAIKEYRNAVTKKDVAKAKAALTKVYQTLDKMAKVGLVKRGKVNRLKSRLAKKLPRG